ncbi:MAG: SoxR reducing system RseC family protein [Bacteroidales bacterium]|jgi:sigma-E factor negative regulatory protein RseC|nr:SoxR reducing system RseC family protein [Bacteroidales bacterium]
MENVVCHKGTVISVSETEVCVKIERTEACGGCANKTSCRMGKQDEQTVTVQTKDAETYCMGEEVNISMKTSLGLKAVLYAYILPLVFLLVAFAIAHHFIASEPLQIILALFPVIVYYTILYRMRRRMEKTFQFYISKIGFEH